MVSAFPLTCLLKLWARFPFTNHRSP